MELTAKENLLIETIIRLEEETGLEVDKDSIEEFFLSEKKSGKFYIDLTPKDLGVFNAIIEEGSASVVINIHPSVLAPGGLLAECGIRWKIINREKIETKQIFNLMVEKNGSIKDMLWNL